MRNYIVSFPISGNYGYSRNLRGFFAESGMCLMRVTETVWACFMQTTNLVHTPAHLEYSKVTNGLSQSAPYFPNKGTEQGVILRANAKSYQCTEMFAL